MTTQNKINTDLSSALNRALRTRFPIVSYGPRYHSCVGLNGRIIHDYYVPMLNRHFVIDHMKDEVSQTYEPVTVTCAKLGSVCHERIGWFWDVEMRDITLTDEDLSTPVSIVNFIDMYMLNITEQIDLDNTTHEQIELTEFTAGRNSRNGNNGFYAKIDTRKEIEFDSDGMVKIYLDRKYSPGYTNNFVVLNDNLNFISEMSYELPKKDAILIWNSETKMFMIVNNESHPVLREFVKRHIVFA